jgi:hypothetical protein
MVEVYVWPPDFKTGNVGHCSMMVFADDEQRKFYISWWPGVGYSAQDFLADKCTKATVQARGEDEAAEGKPPLPAIRIESLDENAIAAFWQKFLSDARNRYCGKGVNCSTVVYRALRAGGATGNDQVTVWSPLLVRSYALGLSVGGVGSKGG